MKRIVSIILILCGLMSVFGCQKNRNLVSVKATQTKLSVGDTTTVQVCFNKMEGVRSFAIRPEIDEESFVIVSARNINGKVYLMSQIVNNDVEEVCGDITLKITEHNGKVKDTDITVTYSGSVKNYQGIENTYWYINQDAA